MNTSQPIPYAEIAAFYRTGDHAQAAWEAAARRLLDEGQFFLAYDLARTGLDRFPGSLLLTHVAAQALYQTGSLDEARALLDPLAGSSPPDEETLGLLARVYKDLWKRSDALPDAHCARDAYLRAYRLTGGTWTGINAATLSWLTGERAAAQRLAWQVLERCDALYAEPGRDDAYWLLTTMGEARLLLGEEAEAIRAYEQAVRLARGKHRQIVSARQQLRLLAGHGFPVPDALFRLLRPPAILVFTGHMIDRPDRPAPRFPPALEAAVRDGIERQIDDLQADIGYGGAACGADLLFVEAMLERGAEVNLVLPFKPEDYLRLSVAYAGPRWVRRFQQALRRVHSVKYVTEESHLGDDVLFGFANRILHGYAALRARTLDTVPSLLAVWDETPDRLPGGTASFVAEWPDPDRLRIIPLNTLPRRTSARKRPARTAPGDGPPAEPAPSPFQRVIRTMLFADIVGYSKLHEEDTPFYVYEFLERVARHLAGLPGIPALLNTWGDALFAVMEEAMGMAAYALALQQVICATDWVQAGLPAPMNVRIALHAGPVFAGTDPFTGRPNYYGAHVNRAARIEPVTVPGRVYASEQFAALLTAEQQAAGQEPFMCDYVGTLALAKNFGPQAVYHLRRI